MRKFVLVPVVSLGGQTKGQFLELMSEPACFGGVNMQTLKSYGFEKNIAAVEKMLTGLNYQPSSADLYLTGYLTNLSDLHSINLGLFLACFMQEPSCFYQKIIVTGRLDLTNPQLPVSASEHFAAKVQAIIGLGKQSEPVPFFLPQELITKKSTPLLSRLASLNIVLKPIDSLFDALLCFGINKDTQS